MKHWYAVHTKARQEAVAVDNLKRQAFHTYLPRIAGARRRKGRWQTAVEPLFPGYVFVQLDALAQSIAPIRSTRGVIGLVCFGDELRPVPDGVISALSQAQPDEQAPIDPTNIFKKGDRVQIVDGPMTGMTAIFEAKSGAERVVLLLDLLGRSNRIACSPHNIAPAA